ncbi:MAG: hypothetical protein Kow001_16600 [Acidobacteriota bacterium]
MFGLEPKLPHVLGAEGGGTVVAVGDRVCPFRKGDRVYGLILMRSPKGGFYAKYATACSSMQRPPLSAAAHTGR